MQHQFLQMKEISAPYTDGISEINNTQVYNAKDINVVMPIYNLIN